VVGNFRTCLHRPQIGIFNAIVGWFKGVGPARFSTIGDGRLAPRAPGVPTLGKARTAPPLIPRTIGAGGRD
jgi:hypothetical protein